MDSLLFHFHFHFTINLGESYLVPRQRRLTWESRTSYLANDDNFGESYLVPRQRRLTLESRTSYLANDDNLTGVDPKRLTVVNSGVDD